MIKKINAKVKSGTDDTKVVQSARQDDGRSYKILESSKSHTPVSLIDGRFLEDLIRSDQQPEIDIEKSLKLRKKKKRKKGLRH